MNLEVEVIGHDKGIEISVDLQKCLEELEDEERELMSMVPFHSYQEIEEELNISSANVRTKICRARNKLSSAWDSDMNDQDKVLISTYLDNELTQEESTYVESLIENDDEALAYLNKLKEINNQTESFFQEALNSNEFKNFQSFVDDLKPKKKVSLKSILKTFLFLRPLPVMLYPDCCSSI